MRLLRLLYKIGAAVLSLAVLCAQSKVDFSGKWTLDTAKNSASVSASMVTIGKEMTIAQDDKRLTITHFRDVQEQF